MAADNGVGGLTAVKEVPGLFYLPNFLTEDEERELLEDLEKDDGWKVMGTGRRVLHYGHVYSYTTESVEMIEEPTYPGVPFFPPFLNRLRHKILAVKKEDTSRELFFPGDIALDQLIINEYSRSQGIKPHVDRKHCFGPFVVAVSLGVPSVEIEFISPHREKVVNVKVEARSLYVMSGPARYEWQHGFAGNQIRGPSGNKRISLTFRTITPCSGIPSKKLKKPPLTLNPSTEPATEGHVVRFIELPNDIVGQIVGKRGKDLRKLKKQTAADIAIGQLPDALEDPTHTIARVEGSLEAVQTTVKWIEAKIESLLQNQREQTEEYQ